jgi:hypothetical protein
MRRLERFDAVLAADFGETVAELANIDDGHVEQLDDCRLSDVSQNSAAALHVSLYGDCNDARSVLDMSPGGCLKVCGRVG